MDVILLLLLVFILCLLKFYKASNNFEANQDGRL
jgi:hypothetical protein